MRRARVIAFYLPQYHPTPNNENWWGKGFTEWTNVGKAIPLFKGHYQPKVPADLGYYDLRLPEVRRKQAELAKNAGIEGFCYYHYWFENGKEELDLPFKEVVASGDPNYPFCLCWANESWHRKSWNADGTAHKELLAEQKYLGKEDNEKHFYSLLAAFKDKRYITYYGKPVFLIYQALQFGKVIEFMEQWNELARANGLPGFHFVSQSLYVDEIDPILNLGFNGVNLLRLNNFARFNNSRLYRGLNRYYHKIFKTPFKYEYRRILHRLVGVEELQSNVYPSLVPNWDHTPRSGKGGYLLHNCDPKYFKKHILMVLKTVLQKDEEDRFIFLKSWNEWGEGNYVEPDLRYGHGYLNVMKETLLY